MNELGVVYRWENLINGKGYTGWTTNWERRKYTHERMDGKCPAFHNALAKYGIDNFRFDILEHNVPIKREVFWIATFGDFGNGYNLSEGGKGHISWTHEQRQHLSEMRKGEKNPFFGRKHKPENLQKMIRKGEKNGLFGKNHKPETIAKISKAQKGKSLSVETRQKISEARQGSKHTPETRQMMSESQRGENHSMFGKKHSVETRQKMSVARSGENNPMFGRTGEKHNRTRPEYMQAKWEFILLYPLGIEKARKQLREKFSDVSQTTIWNWTNKWQNELQTA